MNNDLKLAPEQQEIVTRAETISGEVSTFVIRNQPEFDLAGERRKEIKATYKQIEELRFSFTRPLDELKKKWMEFFNVPLAKLDSADKVLERGRITYQQEQERKRQIEQEKLRRQAEAEEARKRREKEEQERAWREKEEAARKEAERLAEQGKAKEAAKAAAEAEKAAKLAEERRREAESVQVVAPVIASTIAQTAGISARKTWKFEVVDEKCVPREYLTLDMVKIGKRVRSCGDTISIPGIRIYSEEGEAVRV